MWKITSNGDSLIGQFKTNQASHMQRHIRTVVPVKQLYFGSLFIRHTLSSALTDGREVFSVRSDTVRTVRVGSYQTQLHTVFISHYLLSHLNCEFCHEVSERFVGLASCESVRDGPHGMVRRVFRDIQ